MQDMAVDAHMPSLHCIALHCVTGTSFNSLTILHNDGALLFKTFLPMPTWLLLPLL